MLLQSLHLLKFDQDIPISSHHYPLSKILSSLFLFLSLSLFLLLRHRHHHHIPPLPLLHSPCFVSIFLLRFSLFGYFPTVTRSWNSYCDVGSVHSDKKKKGKTNTHMHAFFSFSFDWAVPISQCLFISTHLLFSDSTSKWFFQASKSISSPTCPFSLHVILSQNSLFPSTNRW